MFQLPTVRVVGTHKPITLVQGGMGAGISLANLAGSVARRGGMGTISAIALDLMVSHRLGRKVSAFEAAKLEVEWAKTISQGNGAIALNLMWVIQREFREYVLGAISGGVDAIVVGAGLPLSLPVIVSNANVALIPIVSSPRALSIICAKWRKHNHAPDAVILEGPLAGGHLGFKKEEINDPSFRLEAIFPPVLRFAKENDNFPVIVAGGIWNRADIIHWTNKGAGGVQMGTRFLATDESSASPKFKEAVVRATASDIVVTDKSPSGMLFRVIQSSPGYVNALKRDRQPSCRLGYMLHEGKYRAFDDPDHHFCICEALMGASHREDLRKEAIHTVGANAAWVTKIRPVDDLIDELLGTSL